ncbi:MAG: ABC transporter permease [Acidobacteria bacterium]|nr:ABC transporter permease [Acidobacteriota bacterium]MCB9397321.1 ABC transporter permease [Acidobacteriota bacterium]
MIGNRALLLSYHKAWADLKAETERYFAGFAWWFFEPILHMVTNYVVFSLLLGHNEDNYVAFLLCGLVLWRWIVATVTEGAGSLLTEKWLIQQVYVPKTVMPSVSLFTHTFKFFLVLMVLMIYLWFNGFSPTWDYLYLPYFLLVFFLVIMSMSFLLSSVVPFFPDIRMLLDHFFRLAFFLSGIFFSGDNLPAKVKPIFYLNPFAHLIELTRDVLLNKEVGSLMPLHIILLGALFVLAIGVSLLKKFDSAYAKISF